MGKSKGKGRSKSPNPTSRQQSSSDVLDSFAPPASLLDQKSPSRVAGKGKKKRGTSVPKRSSQEELRASSTLDVPEAEIPEDVVGGGVDEEDQKRNDDYADAAQEELNAEDEGDAQPEGAALTPAPVESVVASLPEFDSAHPKARAISENPSEYVSTASQTPELKNALDAPSSGIPSQMPESSQRLDEKLLFPPSPTGDETLKNTTGPSPTAVFSETGNRIVIEQKDGAQLTFEHTAPANALEAEIIGNSMAHIPVPEDQEVLVQPEAQVEAISAGDAPVVVPVIAVASHQEHVKTDTPAAAQGGVMHSLEHHEEGTTKEPEREPLLPKKKASNASTTGSYDPYEKRRTRKFCCC